MCLWRLDEFGTAPASQEGDPSQRRRSAVAEGVSPLDCSQYFSMQKSLPGSNCTKSSKLKIIIVLSLCVSVISVWLLSERQYTARVSGGAGLCTMVA